MTHIHELQDVLKAIENSDTRDTSKAAYVEIYADGSGVFYANGNQVGLTFKHYRDLKLVAGAPQLYEKNVPLGIPLVDINTAL